jgi:uncharacterized protein
MKSPHPLHTLNGMMNVASGIKFNILCPKPDMICIEDIAIGLANKGHFSGQTPHYFSIAQHCLLALHNLLKVSCDDDCSLELAVLLHDAAEAYIGDIIKPIKVLLPYFSEIENRIMDQVAIRFQIPRKLFDSPIVKACDRAAQEQEFETFFNGSTEFIKHYLTPGEAAKEFMSTFIDLNK